MRLLRATRLGILCASGGLLLAALVFMIQFYTERPHSIWDYGWYYGLPVEAENVGLLALWVGTLGLAVPDPKRVILASMVPLNFAYAYTSQAFWGNSGTESALENLELRLGARFFPTLSVLDYVCLFFFLVILAMVFMAYRKTGIFVVLLRMFQIGSLAVLPLALEIYFFLPVTLNTYVASVQQDTILQGFTNLDLLYASVSLLIGSTVLLVLRRASTNPRSGVERASRRARPSRS